MFWVKVNYPYGFTWTPAILRTHVNSRVMKPHRPVPQPLTVMGSQNDCLDAAGTRLEKNTGLESEDSIGLPLASAGRIIT